MMNTSKTALVKIAKKSVIAIVLPFVLAACAGGLGGGTKTLADTGIELEDWYLSVPTDVDGNGKADSIYEQELVAGYVDPKYFYPSKDGGITFVSPTEGFKTSKNTRYVRSELREMLRRGDKAHKTRGVNKNNWVFSSAPIEDQRKAGGVDGELTGTLAVNHVTTQGKRNLVGRVVIAQIHANRHEPIRLYYRKLPENEKGSVYFVHEPLTSDDIKVNVIGSRSKSARNIADGIALDEKWSYKITVKGHSLAVTVMRDGKPDVVKKLDMSESGYDVGGQYMYFKAGSYVQDNSPGEYAQVTYYKLENSHGSL